MFGHAVSYTDDKKEVIKMKRLHLCPECKDNMTDGDESQHCFSCRYKATLLYTLDQPRDLQDWEFAHCEECGSSLDSKGQCRNTSCGNSPFQGTDWI